MEQFQEVAQRHLIAEVVRKHAKSLMASDLMDAQAAKDSVVLYQAVALDQVTVEVLERNADDLEAEDQMDAQVAEE